MDSMLLYATFHFAWPGDRSLSLKPELFLGYPVYLVKMQWRMRQPGQDPGVPQMERGAFCLRTPRGLLYLGVHGVFILALQFFICDHHSISMRKRPPGHFEWKSMEQEGKVQRTLKVKRGCLGSQRPACVSLEELLRLTIQNRKLSTWMLAAVPRKTLCFAPAWKVCPVSISSEGGHIIVSKFYL